jgi:DNA polymerase
MSQPETRGELLQKLRISLAELAAEGIDFVARPGQREPGAAEARVPAQAVPSTTEARAERALSSGGFDPNAVTDRAEGLRMIRKELGDCTRCRLHEARRSIVFGEGNPEAPVVFVGEGPGVEEDRTGRPFVGRAGELLTKMIESVGWRREDVYICNIVKCRPPKNRDPHLDEVATCRPFLDWQLLAIRPHVIVTLGKPAISTLLGRNVAITKLRGIWQVWNGISVMPTYHPAYLLRNYTREVRQAVWDDLRTVREHVDEAATRP